jgi:hypothetical protein
MNDSVKTASAPHSAAVRGNLYRAAIVGAGSLKGKEVAEMLSERNFPAADIRLLDDDDAMGRLEAMGDEISFIQRVRAEQFEHVDFTFFASDEECTRANWKDARDAGSVIIDLSGSSLENEARRPCSVTVGRARTRANPRAGTAAGAVCGGASGRSHLGCCCSCGLRRPGPCGALWPRFSNLLQNTASAAWTNCTSRP